MREKLKMGSARLMWAVAAMVVAYGLAATASAQPTARIIYGKTSVKLSATFLGAAEMLGVEVDDIGRASIRKGKARFPIPGGAIDLSSLKGQILHVGGLSLAAGATVVDLSEFIIDTTGPSPVLSGLAAVDDAVVGRIDLFNLELTELPSVYRNRLRLRGVNVTLTAGAAETLNSVFGVTAFVEGLEIGEARVYAILEGRDRHHHDHHH